MQRAAELERLLHEEYGRLAALYYLENGMGQNGGYLEHGTPTKGGGLSAYDGESPAVIGGVFGLPYFTRTPRRRTEQPDAVSQHRDVTRDTRRLSPSRAHVPPATTSATPATTSATGWRNDSAVVQKGSNDGPGTDAPRSERERKRKSTASPRRAEKQSPAGERNPLSSAFGPKARGLEPARPYRVVG